MDQATTGLRFGPVTVVLGDRNGKYPDANLALVGGPEARAVLDAPPCCDRVAGDLAASDLCILTHVHEDHIAGLRWMPHLPVHVHAADLPAIQSRAGMLAAYGLEPEREATMWDHLVAHFHVAPRPDALPYADGATWDLGGGVRITAIHLPGHTAGHCALLVEPEGVLLTGDIDLTGFGPYYGDASSDLAAFRRSIARLAGIEARVWVTGHHRGVYTDRSRFLADLAAYADKIEARDELILARLAARPADFAALARQRMLYPEGHEAIWVASVERRTLQMHLDALLAAGRITQDAAGVFHPVR